MTIQQALEICERIESAIADFRDDVESTADQPGEAEGWNGSDSLNEFAKNVGVDEATVKVIRAGKSL